MQLKVLGSGDAFGSGGRLNACFLISAASGKTLVECGASALISMRRFAVEPNDIDTIIVTHLHADHFSGVATFVLDAQLVSKRVRPIEIVGPAGIADRYRTVMDALYPGAFAVKQKFDINFRELAHGAAQPFGAGGQVVGFNVEHTPGTQPMSLRIELEGRSIAFSGDTSACDGLFSATRTTDVSVLECYYYTRRIKFHLSYLDIIDNIQQLNTKRIIATHMSSDMLNNVPSLPFECAFDGAEYSI